MGECCSIRAMEHLSPGFSRPDTYWGVNPGLSCAGHYKLDREENMDQLFKFFGIPWLIRKILGFIKPRQYLRE